METINEKVKEKKTKMNFFEVLTETFGWIEIVASITLLSGMLGFIIYVSGQNILTLVIGIILTVVGFILGIISATRIWKKRGTVNFISSASATPELDNLKNP